MTLNLKDVILLLHPIIAIVFVFPLIGIVVKMAWQTRQRRLQTATEGKSKIPAVVGKEHFQLGRWLTFAVVGIALLGMTRPIFDNILTNQVWRQAPLKVLLIVLMYAVTIASLFLLDKAKPPIWRGIFASLTSMGLVILGFQDGVYRRDEEWYLSHFYLGITAALFMIFALAIVQNIYQDRSNTWRKIHTIFNCIALLLFLAQGITGTRDLLEIPLSWQENYIYKCNFDKNSPAYKTCPTEIPKSNKFNSSQVTKLDL
ncbi:hypothetical protein NIES25_68690 (plasmid) [Nostoc linckia NIES-25]|nr:hypothetical protein NIES25_68690 [Nostoc linckia NIES-25]